jgi:hypothetical protein
MGAKRMAKIVQNRYTAKTKQAEGDQMRLFYGNNCRYCGTWSEKVKKAGVYICEDCYATNPRRT